MTPTYPRGVAWCDLRGCLPSFVADALAEALPALGRKLHGFADAGAVMTAVEARSSSPVRIVRDDRFQSNIAGLYPAAEGAATRWHHERRRGRPARGRGHRRRTTF